MLNRFNLTLLKITKKIAYNHNEPFDIIRWLICSTCLLFRRKYVESSNISKALDKFASPKIKNTPKLRKKLFHDMLYSALVFGTSFEEYFYFRFDSKIYAERRKFITEHNRTTEFTSLVNDSRSKGIFSNKYETYLKFREYYLRDAIAINSIENYEDFYRFAKKHPKFVCKPLFSNSGYGVEMIDTTHCDSLDNVFADLLSRQECILEELVVQVPEMSALNSSSINTVRVPAVLTKAGVKILYPLLRMGRNNSFVDNAGSGGIFALVDLDTGLICSAAMDEYNNMYVLHPDTGTQIVGFKIPKWTELVELVEKLGHVVPDVRYIGWDLALTDKGWVIIEGNDDGMFIGQQMIDQVGKKEAYYSLINDI